MKIIDNRRIRYAQILADISGESPKAIELTGLNWLRTEYVLEAMNRLENEVRDQIKKDQNNE